MSTALQRLKDIANAAGTTVDKNAHIADGDHLVASVRLTNVEVRRGRMLASPRGFGATVEEAAADYLTKITGKRLVLNYCLVGRRHDFDGPAAADDGGQ